MGGKQRIYKQRIRSTETLKKVFRAMELIAASRIAKARKTAAEGDPYDRALSKAVAAVSLHASLEHPLLNPRSDTNKVAVLVVTSDRGMAGAYSANILRNTEILLKELKDEGKVPVVYACGRRAQSYFSFHNIPVAKAWEGNSDAPHEETISEIAKVLLEDFLAPADKGGVSEVRIVFTRFKSMVKQVPEVRKMLPLLVVDDEDEKAALNMDSYMTLESDLSAANPLYEFEPNADEVFAQLLPLYVRSRIRNALMQAAASELAARQQAMHTATENAEDIINNYTRLANSARQAEITQEISEIVSGADALASE